MKKKKGQEASLRKNAKTLSLSKDTIRMLNDRDFSQVAGGMEGSGQTGCRPPYGCRTN
jgi:hypothetical protein